MSKLGEQLVRLRERVNWTQERLAHSAGMSQSYLCQLEKGQVLNPGARTLLRLANAFQVPLDYFREAIEEDAHD